MIILFNINNKEVLSQVDNERIMYVFNLAVSMNKENNEKGEHNFIGMTFAPEEAWLWDEKRLKEFLNEQENWGQVIWEGKREVVFVPKGRGLRVGAVKGGKWFVFKF